MSKKEIEFNYNTGKVERKFTPEQFNQGAINMDRLPDLVKSLVEQNKSMREYINSLHDMIDDVFKKNHICIICEVAECQSDHK